MAGVSCGPFLHSQENEDEDERLGCCEQLEAAITSYVFRGPCFSPGAMVDPLPTALRCDVRSETSPGCCLIVKRTAVA
jgi:hypothetical protein